MNKLEIYQYIINNLEETYKAKNSDYGDSVGDTYNKFGDVSFLTRISDKYNRICSLSQSNESAKVVDEKIDDTILDLANYCILWLVEREYKEQQAKPKEDITPGIITLSGANLEELQKRIKSLDERNIKYHIETRTVNRLTGRVGAVIVIEE